MLAKIIGVIIATFVIASIERVRPFAIPFFIVALAAVFVIEGVRVVPQQSAWVVERLGKFHADARAGPEHHHSRSSTASPTGTR